MLALRLAQAVEQMAAPLAQQHRAGHLAIEAGTEDGTEDGTEHAGDPGRAVAAAAAHLQNSGELAEQLGAALARAARALAHLSYDGPEPGPTPGRRG